MTIDSNVEGADVAIEGNIVGTTPFTGKIKRQKEAVATVSAPGYKSQSITLTTSYNSVALLSIFWDLSTTDFLTGAVWEYAPNSYYVNLKPTGMSDADFRSESTLKAFAMTYFGDLKVEMAAGDGPKLRALHDEYFSHHELGAFVNKLRKAEQGDAASFGEAVARMLRS